MPAAHAAAAPVPRAVALRWLALTFFASTQISLVKGLRWPSHTRRAVLGAAGLAAAAPPWQHANAAIPSFSEYDAVQYRKAAAPAPPSESAPNAAAVDPLTAIRRADAELAQLSAFLEREAFEDIRAALRAPLFQALGYKPGLRSTSALAAPASLLAAIPRSAQPTARAALSDMLLDLKALDDYCFQNRVIFFNEEDKVHLEDLKLAPEVRPAEVDLSEPRSLIADARDRMQQVMDLL